MLDFNRCTRCGLHLTTRNRISGCKDLPVDLLFLDETPSIECEATGSSRISKGYQLMEFMLRDVAEYLRVKPCTFDIMPITFCRAADSFNSGTRDPHPREVLACTPNVLSRVRELQPKRIYFMDRVVEKFYKKEFPSAINIVHPMIIYRQGGSRSCWWMPTLRKLIESHPIRSGNAKIKKENLG